MQQIPSSNLLLLVTDPTCDCSAFPPVLQEATEVKYILTVPQGGRLLPLVGGSFFKAEASLPHLPFPTEHPLCSPLAPLIP